MLGLPPFRFSSALSGSKEGWKAWMDKHAQEDWKSLPGLWDRALGRSATPEKIRRLLGAGVAADAPQKNGKPYLRGLPLEEVLGQPALWAPMVQASVRLPWNRWMDRWAKLRRSDHELSGKGIKEQFRATFLSHQHPEYMLETIAVRCRKDWLDFHHPKKCNEWVVGGPSSVLRRVTRVHRDDDVEFYSEVELAEVVRFQLDLLQGMFAGAKDDQLLEWAKNPAWKALGKEVFSAEASCRFPFLDELRSHARHLKLTETLASAPESKPRARF